MTVWSWNKNYIGTIGIFVDQNPLQHRLIEGKMIAYVTGINFSYATIQQANGSKCLIRR